MDIFDNSPASTTSSVKNLDSLLLNQFDSSVQNQDLFDSSSSDDEDISNRKQKEFIHSQMDDLIDSFSDDDKINDTKNLDLLNQFDNNQQNQDLFDSSDEEDTGDHKHKELIHSQMNGLIDSISDDDKYDDSLNVRMMRPDTHDSDSDEEYSPNKSRPVVVKPAKTISKQKKLVKETIKKDSDKEDMKKKVVDSEIEAVAAIDRGLNKYSTIYLLYLLYFTFRYILYFTLYS